MNNLISQHSLGFAEIVTDENMAKLTFTGPVDATMQDVRKNTKELLSKSYKIPATILTLDLMRKSKVIEFGTPNEQYVLMLPIQNFNRILNNYK